MRTITLLLGLALAGCSAKAAHEMIAPASEPATGSVRSPLARAAQASGQKDDWWKEGGVTREKINAMCWMKHEQGRSSMPVEKRADLVNACVTATLKDYPSAR